jgi:hypothetical protein
MLLNGWVEPQGQSGWVQTISHPPEFSPQTIQLVASHYTDYTITTFVIWLHACMHVCVCVCAHAHMHVYLSMQRLNVIVCFNFNWNLRD